MNKETPMKHLGTLFAFILAISFAPLQAQTLLDFEDGDLDDWEVIDEDVKNLGDVGPSSWEVRNAQFLDGRALFQGSNIWGSPADSVLMGTQILYTGEEYIDFVMELDVAHNDNDGVGLVWAWEDLTSHYRVMLMNDRWPDVPLDGFNGPMAIAHTRISNDEPWYDLDPLAVIQGADYVNYPEGGLPMHWTLTVDGTSFSFESDHGVKLEGDLPESREGMIGVQLYAHQAEFDNISIISTYPVDAQGKATTTWAGLKASE